MKLSAWEENILSLLQQSGFGGGNVPDIEFEQLNPDGSQRRFFRLHLEGKKSLMAVLPPEDSANGLRESRSAWKIGCHLEKIGSPVPKMVAFDRDSGFLLCEDLGDVRLYDLVTQKGGMPRQHLEMIYKDVIKDLVRMQLRGGEGLAASWCWDSPCYDRKLMLERESGYFLQSFCRDYLKLDVDDGNLAAEFLQLTLGAAKAPAVFFLHRDFQSRNIMIKDNRIRFIDFQGGRLGPLGYDLASLLIDPYVCLSQDLQDDLLAFYLVQLAKKIRYDEREFRHQYLMLALQRNLQALGAFGFLTGKRGKTFFGSAIAPALLGLQSLLAKPELAGYPVLRKLADSCLFRISKPEFRVEQLKP